MKEKEKIILLDEKIRQIEDSDSSTKEYKQSKAGVTHKVDGLEQLQYSIPLADTRFGDF